MPSPTDLQAVCEELLTASAESLDTIPTFDSTLIGAPDRQFVASGSPVLDCCEQLTVHATQVQDGPTAPGGLAAGRKIAGKITHVFLVVTISRCYPVPDDRGNPPSAEAQDNASKQLNADAWALWNHLYNLWTADMLFTLCSEVFWDAMRPLGPSGGCAGWMLGIHISLSGYNEAASS